MQKNPCLCTFLSLKFYAFWLHAIVRGMHTDVEDEMKEFWKGKVGP